MTKHPTSPRLTGKSLGRPQGSSGTDTRARLLEIAATLFARQGYSEVSMADIAGAAGLTAPAIYNYFGSKDALFIDTVCNMYEEIAASFLEAAASGTTWRERLSAILEMASQVYREDSVLQRLGTVATIKSSQGPERFALILGAKRQVDQVFHDIIADAVDNGELPQSINRPIAGELLSSLILSGIGGVTHQRPTQNDFDAIVAAFKIFLDPAPLGTKMTTDRKQAFDSFLQE